MFKGNRPYRWAICALAIAAPALLTSAPAVAQAGDASYLYGSNYYTQPDGGNWTPRQRTIPAAYEKVAQTASLALYVDPHSLAIAVRNLATGYLWTSIPSRRELRQEQLNSVWNGAVQSPLMVNYFDAYANSNMGSFSSLGGQVSAFARIPGGFTSTLYMPGVGLRLQMRVTVSGDSLKVGIPGSSISEYGANKVGSLLMYPFLGAVHKADIPGYMFIPDGSGALIRYSNLPNQFSEPYQAQIYGHDVAVTGYTPSNINQQHIAAPVFGVVHGVNQNGFLAIVQNGQYNADIVANPSGVTTNLNWVSAQFTMRYPYFQPTSLNMGGYNTFQQHRINGSMQVQYVFLSGQNANYVGMAGAYRSYLAAQGVLHRLAHAQAHVPLEIDMLGAEMTPGLLWNNVIDMTTFSQAGAIVNSLEKQGIHGIEVFFRGWSQGGLTARNPVIFPVSGSLGGAQGLAQLQKVLAQKHVPLYLYANFTDAYGNGNGFQKISNAARDVTNQIIQRQAVPQVGVGQGGPFGQQNGLFSNLFSYYINPTTALSIAHSDIAGWRQAGVTGVAVDRTGYKLFANFNPASKLTREQAAAAYQTMAGQLARSVPRLDWYSPNAYLWKYSRQILQIPMSSSQYMYESDTVPFLQAVLHGYVQYFAPFSNFNADPRTSLLRMIDFGAYPSFYLTYEPAWKLKNTPSRDIYTSRYSDWKAEIQAEYQAVDRALKGVQNTTLQSRTVLTWGLVEDAYANGVRIVVNYRSTPMRVGKTVVGARNFAVLGGKS